jgi:hypothetical protein
MRAIQTLAILIVVTGHVTKAEAYACNDQHYINSSGHVVHSPSCGIEPDHKTAECRDGSVSHSEHLRGTCSHHGGVAHWD